MSILQASLEALIAALPGFQLVLETAEPPPQVLIWNSFSVTLTKPTPKLAPETTLIILISSLQNLTQLPEAAGLITIDETVTTLISGLRQVAHGQRFRSPKVVSYLQQQKSQTASFRLAVDTLTPRERELLALLTQGMSNKEMAKRLSLNVRTVEGHLTNLFAKLGMHSRTQAALMAVQHNFKI